MTAGLWGASLVMMFEPLRCSECHDVLGVYERVVAVQPDGQADTTSLLAAETDSAVRLGDATLYHADCFAEANQPQP